MRGDNTCCDLENFIKGVEEPKVHFESLGPVNARNKATVLEHSEESVTVGHIITLQMWLLPDVYL